MSPETAPASGIVIRRDSGLPIYRQLVDQLRFLIGAGRYRAGDLLPTMRELAAELGLNLNTVNRAYRQLQRDGLIRSTPGKGAAVVGAPATAGSSAAPAVDAILAAAVERALASGLTPRAIAERIDEILSAFDARVPPPPRIAVAGGWPWRSRSLAEGLRPAVVREVLALEDAGSDTGAPDLVVLPRYGAWCPDRSGLPAGIPVVEVPVLPDRDAVRRLVGLEPGARLLVVAGDEGVARWLADAATTFAVPASTRHVVATAAATATAGEGEVAVVEAGAPGADALRASAETISVSPAFPPTIADEVDRALAR